jgi:hypothetical protein
VSDDLDPELFGDYLDDDRRQILEWGQREVIAHWIEDVVDPMCETPYQMADDLIRAIVFNADLEFVPHASAERMRAAEADRDRLQAAMVPMLGAFKALEQYLTAVRAGEAPAEGAVAVIAAGVDMMRQAVEKHGTIERQPDTEEGT